MFSVICAWINSWVNNREAGDLRRHPGLYDVIVSALPSLFLVNYHFGPICTHVVSHIWFMDIGTCSIVDSAVHFQFSFMIMISNSQCDYMIAAGINWHLVIRIAVLGNNDNFHNIFNHAQNLISIKLHLSLFLNMKDSLLMVTHPQGWMIIILVNKP